MYVCSLDKATASGIAYKNEDILYRESILATKRKIEQPFFTANKQKPNANVILLSLGANAPPTFQSKTPAN